MCQLHMMAAQRIHTCWLTATQLATGLQQMSCMTPQLRPCFLETLSLPYVASKHVGQTDSLLRACAGRPFKWLSARDSGLLQPCCALLSRSTDMWCTFLHVLGCLAAAVILAVECNHQTAAFAYKQGSCRVVKWEIILGQSQAPAEVCLVILSIGTCINLLQTARRTAFLLDGSVRAPGHRG